MVKKLLEKAHGPFGPFKVLIFLAQNDKAHLIPIKKR